MPVLPGFQNLALALLCLKNEQSTTVAEIATVVDVAYNNQKLLV
jgi:hypothetical protein